MTEDNKQNIWIRIADVKKIPLSINRDDEETFRKAEDLVNRLYSKWLARFQDTSTPHEVMARVAFQFARLYVEQSSQSEAVDSFLEEFEKKLDDIVVKI
ncbi:MAG: cell division protein ZapA [Muribaculaceae bacterium]|jgi:hypothetical protein|nr:cell division protein ZapA [Muribaculaceae bacterium]